MLPRVIVFAGVAAAVASLQAAPPPEASRGIAADGRVVTSPYGVPPPWGRDVMHLENPHYPEALRAKHPVATGFFRLIFDLRTGRVRQVIVERSSGYPDADANIVTALRQWRLKPNTWKEFQVHLSMGIGQKPPHT
jgi:TonB family protein